MMLVRAGMDAETLAAAGVTSGSVTTAVGRIRENLMGSITQLRAADAAFMSAQQDLRSLDQLIRSGRASDEQKSQRAAKASALASATATRDGLISGLWTAAGDAVTEAQRLRATTIRNNRHREVPLIYRAGSFTDAQWIALRDALSESRRTASTGEELPGALADVLSAALGDQGVAFAKSHLEGNGATVSVAWEAAAVVPTP